MKKNISSAVVIGAGIGGLSVACRLANRGISVTVIERNSNVGGKCNEFVSGDYRFDTGPSLLTMPFLLDELFEYCDYETSDYLTIEKLEVVCKYFYDSGKTLTCYSDHDKTLEQIAAIAPNDVKNYTRFLKKSELLYNRTKDAFLFNPLADFEDIKKLKWFDLLRIDALSSLSSSIDRSFKSNELRMLFKRFATYNGSNPYKAPATLNVIPHVELNMGAYYPKGGTYMIPNSLAELAKSLGVKLKLNEDVKNVVVEKQTITKVETDKTSYSSDIVISNADAHEFYLSLVNKDSFSSKSRNKLEALEPSCAGFVALLGGKIEKSSNLEHHNILFTDDYKNEFNEIFDKKTLPTSPTVYIANTSKSNAEHAPEGKENLFILVNAPYLSDVKQPSKEEYLDAIVTRINKSGFGVEKSNLDVIELKDPHWFYDRFKSYKGSIYGTSSNTRLAAFRRPNNRSPYFKNAYLVGGSTHPGGGIPLVLISAKNVETLISRDFTF